jgi:RNA polymerase sigma-70 factor (ECF subfamily)
MCVNHLKQRKIHEGNISFEDYMISQDDKSHSNDTELLELINAALDTLPDKYKEMFILREFDGLSYNDIAEVTEETVANVKIRIHRSKQKIREILEPYIKELDKL